VRLCRGGCLGAWLAYPHSSAHALYLTLCQPLPLLPAPFLPPLQPSSDCRCPFHVSAGSHGSCL
jgi:hypothetical protein